MSNKKRITIRCWNTPDCGREYSWLATFDGRPTLLIACSFCGAEAKVELKPYAAPVMDTFAWMGSQGRSTTNAAAQTTYTLDRLKLPDVVPSEPRPPSEPRLPAPEDAD